jgi:hypothetical protein
MMMMMMMMMMMVWRWNKRYGNIWQEKQLCVSIWCIMYDGVPSRLFRGCWIILNERTWFSINLRLSKQSPRTPQPTMPHRLFWWNRCMSSSFVFSKSCIYVARCDRKKFPAPTCNIPGCKSVGKYRGNSTASYFLDKCPTSTSTPTWCCWCCWPGGRLSMTTSYGIVPTFLIVAVIEFLRNVATSWADRPRSLVVVGEASFIFRWSYDGNWEGW